MIIHLFHLLEKKAGKLKGKYMVIKRSELPIYISALKAQKKSIVFTNGCFDILHIGHIHYLEAAKSLGDVLIVGMNTDKSVSDLKGPDRPINQQDDRANVLSALRAVDVVVLFDESTPLSLISEIMPDILVKGGDYTLETIVGADIVLAHQGKVEIIPFVDGKSTSSIINKIKSL